MCCIFLDVEVYRAVDLIGISGLYNRLDHPDLLNNMTRSRRLDAGIQIVELMHRPMKEIGIFLNQLHRFQLFQYGLLGDLIFGLTSFFFKMTGVSDIPNISYLIPKM